MTRTLGETQVSGIPGEMPQLFLAVAEGDAMGDYWGHSNQAARHPLRQRPACDHTYSVQSESFACGGQIAQQRGAMQAEHVQRS